MRPSAHARPRPASRVSDAVLASARPGDQLRRKDVFFVLGLVIGVIGVGLGLAARRRTPSRMATAAIVLSAIPVVWFIVYMIVDAIA